MMVEPSVLSGGKGEWKKLIKIIEQMCLEWTVWLYTLGATENQSNYSNSQTDMYLM